MTEQEYINFVTQHIDDLEPSMQLAHRAALPHEYADYCDMKRAERDALLTETDWWAVADRTMTQAEKDYRQALRDVPQQDGFPVNITWPTKP